MHPYSRKSRAALCWVAGTRQLSQFGLLSHTFNEGVQIGNAVRNDEGFAATDDDRTVVVDVNYV